MRSRPISNSSFFLSAAQPWVRWFSTSETSGAARRHA